MNLICGNLLSLCLENPGVAATREIYEEMGIRSPGHVMLLRTLDEVHAYKTPEGSWLHQQGYEGQHLHWTLFFYPGPDEMPPLDMSGLGGEKQEFVAAEWVTWEALLPRTVWFKRDMYEALQQLAAPVIEEYTASAASCRTASSPTTPAVASPASEAVRGDEGVAAKSGDTTAASSCSGRAGPSFRVSRLLRE